MGLNKTTNCTFASVSKPTCLFFKAFEVSTINHFWSTSAHTASIHYTRFQKRGSKLTQELTRSLCIATLLIRSSNWSCNSNDHRLNSDQ